MTLPKSMHVLQKISNLTATQPASLISASYQSKIHKCYTFTYSCKTFAEHFTFTQYQKLLVRIHTSLVVNLETKSSNQWLNKIIESMAGNTTVPPPIRPLCKNMVCMHEIASCHEGDNKIPQKCGCSSDFPQPPKSSMLTVA